MADAMRDALRLGRANQHVVELTHAHCTHPEFILSPLGGRGLAEEASGLPIDARTLRCPYAPSPTMSGSNLESLAVEFYRANCVGCSHHAPTGNLPNLGSHIASLDAADQAVSARTELRAIERRARATNRAESRAALAALEPLTASYILTDLTIVDTLGPGDDQVEQAASRLAALASSAPEQFSPGAVSEFLAVLADDGASSLFDVLRMLARAGHAESEPVIGAALVRLTRQADRTAARVLVDLEVSVRSEQLTTAVLRQLILSAGTPELHGLTGLFSRGRVRDPAGMLTAARIDLTGLLNLLEQMLRPPATGPATGLLLPPGLEEAPPNLDSDLERASAAVAVRAIAAVYPGVIDVISRQLVDSLRVADIASYGVSPTAEITATLAGLGLRRSELFTLISTRGDAADATEDFRKRLFNVAQLAARDMRPRPPTAAVGAASERQPDDWFVPGDPSDAAVEIERVDEHGDFPSTGRQRDVVDLGGAIAALFDTALDKLDGRWGSSVAIDAGEVVAELTARHPHELAPRAGALLGRLMIDPVPPAATLVPPTEQMMAALERMSWSSYLAHRRRKLRESLIALAGVTPSAVADPALDVLESPAPIGDEADPDRLAQADQRLRADLLSMVCNLARRHPERPGLLRRLMPVLYSSLVGLNVSLRVAAVNGWAELHSGCQPLPETLNECLPVLLQDSTVGVVGALQRQILSLPLGEDDRPAALQWALLVCRAATGSNDHHLDLNQAIDVLRGLAYQVGGTPELAANAVALDALADLDSEYQLSRQLLRTWPGQLADSPRFGRQCLRAIRAGGPDRDDEVMVALQRCRGVAEIDQREFREISETDPFGATTIELAEVLLLHGRHDDARQLLASYLAGIADTVEHHDRRVLILLADAISMLQHKLAHHADAATVRIAADAVDHAVTQVRTARSARQQASTLPQPDSPSWVDRLLDAADGQIAATRALLDLAASPPIAAEAAEAAERLTGAAVKLRRAGGLSPAGRLVILAAEVFDVIALVARSEGALQRADSGEDEAPALLAAAKRRAEVAVVRLDPHLAARPTSSAPVAVLSRIRDGINDVQQVASIAVSLPMVVRAASDRSRRSVPALVPGAGRGSKDDDSGDEPILVVLASIDDQPCINHAQVITPNKAYDLGIDVRGTAWPGWAERLDIEVLSELTAADLTVPAYSFVRPVTAAEGNYAFSGSGTLVLRFSQAPGRPPRSARFAATFVGSAQVAEPARRQVADIAGHPSLALRPFDASRDLMTDLPSVDARLLEIFAAVSGQGFPDADVAAWARFLTSIVHAAEKIQFDQTYRRGSRITERQFHNDLEQRLLFDPRLDGRVIRGTRQALGILDLDHDSINAELKVAKSYPVTIDNSHKFLGQPVQYATGVGRRLAILAVLDMSAKSAPPGVLENHIWLMRPSLCGLADPAYPSLVAVVVINANLPTPSTWSRKRIGAVRVI